MSEKKCVAEKERIKRFFGKLMCKLGFHDFKFDHADEQFMPNMRVLIGKCQRPDCIEMDLWFQNFKEKRVFGGHGKCLMSFPMEESDVSS
jgi:hypothetical protein